MRKSVRTTRPLEPSHAAAHAVALRGAQAGGEGFRLGCASPGWIRGAGGHEISARGIVGYTEKVGEFMGEDRRARPGRQEHVAPTPPRLLGSMIAPMDAHEVIGGDIEVAHASHDEHRRPGAFRRVASHGVSVGARQEIAAGGGEAIEMYI